MNKIIELLKEAQAELVANNKTLAISDLKRAKEELNSSIKYAIYCGIPEDEINEILKGIDSAIKISVTRV